MYCKRREVSGYRLWHFVQSHFPDPRAFTAKCLVYNLCPLYFVAKSGKNIPLNDLEISVRKQLISECCQALLEVINLFGVNQIVCLGRFVEAQVKALVKNNQMDNVKVHFLVHPSPASPLANTGWDKIARKTFERLGLLKAVSSDGAPF